MGCQIMDILLHFMATGTLETQWLTSLLVTLEWVLSIEQLFAFCTLMDYTSMPSFEMTWQGITSTKCSFTNRADMLSIHLFQWLVANWGFEWDLVLLYGWCDSILRVMSCSIKTRWWAEVEITQPPVYGFENSPHCVYHYTISQQMAAPLSVLKYNIPLLWCYKHEIACSQNTLLVGWIWRVIDHQLPQLGLIISYKQT